MTNKIIPLHQIGFPINLEIIIPKDDSVRLLYDITEDLNYRELHRVYSKMGRNPVVSPESLFRILIYGYMEGVYSSRKLEKACKRDINFKWLLQGQPVPSHSTLARFRSKKLSNCIDNLFNQLIIKLYEIEEIEFKDIFIDGTKIEADANRYSFVWKKATDKFEAKLQKKLKDILPEILETFNIVFSISDDKLSVKDISIVVDKLEEIKFENRIEFVYGKGKRKSKIQKYLEVLYNFVEKQSKYDLYNTIFDGRNSFSKTDIDATFMHMKEDHMKNGQLKPGYNIQIGVEGEYIVGVDISSQRSDQLTFIPFLDKLESNLNIKYKTVTADAGYESEENYKYLEAHNIESFIKPQTYEKSKTKKFKNDISKRENMTYIIEEDCYVCKNNKKLHKNGVITRKSKSGYEAKVTTYQCESCLECQYKTKCTKAKGNKQLQVAKDFIKLREISLENIKSEKGKLLRMNRSIQVEGAFGVIKQDYGFRRFLTRGKANVRTEFLLMAFGYNINKYHSKSMQKRNGKLLHEQRAS